MNDKKKMVTGHTVEPVTEEEECEIVDSGFMLPSRMVRLQPDGWFIPETLVENYLDKIYNFKFRHDDLLVITYPKSGMTWCQEILWTMVHNPDLNHPETNTPILDRSPDISFDFVFDSPVTEILKFESFRKWFAKECPGRKEEDGMMLQICEMMQGRRIIKCHVPLSLLPPDLLDTVKVVYSARNPKDVMVSYHNMMKRISMTESSSDFDNFVRAFMKDKFIFSPYWRHVQVAWEQRNHPNMFFVFYEEMKADPKKHLQRLNDFIGTGLTQSQLDAVEHHTSFKSMKERGEPMRDGLFSNFFRKGTAGDWKNHFTPELKKEMDAWIEENTRKTGIIHKWE